jgi:RNA polymerase sigma factor (sigma-70 family)
MNEERQLVKQCKTRSAKAFDQLYRRYSPVLWGICLRYGGCQESAEDILQDAFLTIINKIEAYRFEGSFEGWMKKITVNTAINYLRKQKRQVTSDIENDVSNTPISEDIDVVSKLNEQEILDCIRKLPDGYRTVFNLYVIEGYKHKEIAELLGISEVTSRTQFSKARKALQIEILKRNESI